MKIVKVEKTVDNDTFQPTLKVCLDIPLEPIQDGLNSQSKDDFIKQFGISFFDQLRAKM